MTGLARPPAECAGHEVTVTLPDDAHAPSQARTVVREALREWGLSDLVDDAELVVSELVTNALRHGLPPVVLLLRHNVSTLRIDVSDMRPSTSHYDLPVVSQADDESGRGRGIVTSVSDQSGVDETAEDGKSCYASWDVPSESS